MKTYFLLFAWVPLSMAFMGTGQPNFGIYFFWSLALIGAGINTCSAIAKIAAEQSEEAITDEMMRHALRAETKRQWNQRCLALDLFTERGKQ